MVSRIPNGFKIFVLLFSAFFITASGNIDSIDGVADIFLAKQLITQKSISFSKNDNRLGMPVAWNAKNNRYYSLHNAGYAIIQAPGVIFSNGVRSLLGLEKTQFPFKNDFIITLWANFTNAFLVAVIGVLIHANALVLLKRKTLKYWYFIPILVLSSCLFVQAHEHFAHPLFSATFLFALLHFLKFNQSKNVRDLVLFSLWFSFTAISYNVSFILLIPAFFLYQLLMDKKKLLSLFFAVVPGLIIEFIWNFVRFGSIFETGYGILGIQIIDLHPLHFFLRLFALLFGPNKGLFIYNPILILLFFLIIKNKRLSDLVFFLTLFATYLGNYALTVWWHGDATYGPRFFTPVISVALIMFIYQIEKYGLGIRRNIILAFCIIGFFIQIPGLSIPTFSFPFLAPPRCYESEIHYAFSPFCSPIKVGWSHLLKRRIKETCITTSVDKNTNTISLLYPNPVNPFRTIYPDPLFDRFSSYKTTSYNLDKNMMNDIYSFTQDTWWIKLGLYKNITNR